MQEPWNTYRPEESSGSAKSDLISVSAFVFRCPHLCPRSLFLFTSRSSLEAMCGRPQTIVLQM